MNANANSVEDTASSRRKQLEREASLAAVRARAELHKAVAAVSSAIYDARQAHAPTAFIKSLQRLLARVEKAQDEAQRLPT